MNRLLSVEAIYDGGKIKNVSLEEVSVSGSSDVGGLVGSNRGRGKTITNSYYDTNTSGCSDGY